MHDIEELQKTLVELPRRQYSELIKDVDKLRRRAVEHREKEHPLNGKMNRDEFANWIARRHFEVDKGINRIFFLPKGAPPAEVRLLEVNDLLLLPENAPVEALDFMVDVEGADFSLFVADVTPTQFEAVQKKHLALPDGWSLDNTREIPQDDE